LGPTQRAVLDGTPLGHLTPAEITLQGVETFAVCGKQVATGDSPGKREVREEISTQKYNDQSKRFLKELCRGALIEPAECRCPSRCPWARRPESDPTSRSRRGTGAPSSNCRRSTRSPIPTFWRNRPAASACGCRSRRSSRRRRRTCSHKRCRLCGS